MTQTAVPLGTRTVGQVARHYARESGRPLIEDERVMRGIFEIRLDGTIAMHPEADDHPMGSGAFPNFGASANAPLDAERDDVVEPVLREARLAAARDAFIKARGHERACPVPELIAWLQALTDAVLR